MSLSIGKIEDKMKTTRQRILIAVAEGCTNTRQIADHLGLAQATIANYFYEARWSPKWKFRNGDLLQWQPALANTLRLGPNAAVIRDRGRVVAVGRAVAVGSAEKVL